MNNLNIEEIKKRLVEENPEYILVKEADYMNLDKRTYKSLYEENTERTMRATNEAQQIGQENQRLIGEIQSREEENNFLKKELDELRKKDSGDLKQLLSLLYPNKNSIVEATDLDGDKIEAPNEQKTISKEDIAEKPGIYDFEKPSTVVLKNLKEFNTKNLTNKEVGKTKECFKETYSFLKSITSKKPEEMAKTYDENRINRIIDICNNKKYSNNERYIRYMLISPGIDKGFINMLNKASELGLDARVVISLLEQPVDTFNREMIGIYVSSVLKGNEYNLKQELAEELVKGNWYITVKDGDNNPVKYTLLPIEILDKIDERLNAFLKLPQDKNIKANEAKANDNGIKEDE